jgi:hypothetical protein
MQREFDSLPSIVGAKYLDAGADLFYRWKYLEAGVSKIMSNLQEGMDMNTVSALFQTLTMCVY